MKIFDSLLTTALISLAPASMMAENSPGIEILNLDPNNIMVKIPDVESNFLLIPVEESQPVSHIRVVADNNLEDYINIALAAGKADYYVPLDLRRFKGKDLLLDVRTTNDRYTLRDGDEAAWANKLTLADDFDTTNSEYWRPSYHHTPAYGWMNDPNGMFYKDGLWHLYYQYNPYGSKWENMTWGHSTSPDLINWDAQPIAIRPTALGTIFSGSAVVDKDNTAGFGKDAIVAIFTTAGASQTQSMAYSTDGGKTFTQYAANPVIAYERESRDPNFFWDARHNQWVLTLVSALDHEILIYTSPNLKDWTLASKFGHGFGSQAGVWECPDLMEVPVEGSDEKKWVLIININPGGPFGGSAAQYFVGDFDGKTFTCDTPPEVTRWLDYGKDHYATVSFSNAPDDRKTVIAWMSNWQYANEVPTKQYRSANSLPRDLSLFKAPDGQYYLTSVPSPEVDALRGSLKKFGSATISSKGKSFQLPSSETGGYEIQFEATVADNQKLSIVLSNADGEEVVMKLDGADRRFSMDRSKSGEVSFSDNFSGVTFAEVPGNSTSFSFRFFIDRSSIEAFIDGGHLAMTNLLFPRKPYTTLTLRSEGPGVKVQPVSVWTISPKRVPQGVK